MNTFFLVYAILFTLLVFASGITKVILKLRGKYDETPLNVQREELILVPFNAIGLLAMFGYVFQFPVFNALFWKIYFVIWVAYSALSFLLPKHRWLKEIAKPKKFLVLIIVGVIITLPMLYMLWAYAFISFPKAG